MNYEEEIKKLQARVEELEKKSGGVDKSQHNKITLEEFWNSKKKLTIYAETKEQNEKLCKAFDKMGKTLSSGFNYLNLNMEAIKFYWNNGRISRWAPSSMNVYIYDFDEVIFPDEPEPRWSFTEDEKTILRNVPEEYRWISRDGRDAVEYCRLHCWTKKPEKEKWLGGWDNPQDIQLNFMMFEHIFQCIKWEDDEPCEFRKFL